jgi:FkbM family methyltransferase
MYSKADDNIVNNLYFTKKYTEEKELIFFSELAKHSKVIFDIGANTGLYSIVSGLANENSTIYSFEPYRINFQRLNKNIQINNIINVKTIQKALGNSNQMIQFAVPTTDRICDTLSADIEFTNKFYRKWINYKNEDVEQITLDSFNYSNDIKKIDLIKIDVENYEINLLIGAIETLKSNSPNILIEIFVDSSKIAFFDKNILPLGYNIYLIMNEGILRIDQLEENKDCGNFLLSKIKTKKRYNSFKDTSDLIIEFTGK